ncbi:MAG: sugar ABC transporter permease [Spirochaetales bacterium]|nr:sugar ABC transporter permease [Spirochaetales bacterium]
MAGRANFWTIAVLLGPALILFTTFVIIPVFQAAAFSLYKWNGLGPMKNFLGLANYQQFFSDLIVQKALSHNLIIAVISLAVELPLAMALALIVSNSKFKGAVFFRTFFFLPYMLSEVITGVLWQFIYHPQYGLITTLHGIFSPDSPVPTLLGDPSTVLWAILVVIIWKYFGLHMTIYIAGLQAIPQEQIEAATIDGASKTRIFLSVILPGMRTAVQLSVFFSVLGSIQLFDIIWAMGKGGPVNASETIVSYMYRVGLSRFNIGYGSTIAVCIFVICLIFSIIYQRLLVKEAE